MTTDAFSLVADLKPARADHRSLAYAGYALILASFGACGLWAATAPLDSAAIAPGQIEVDGRAKPIQHLEGGIVKEALVREAQAVKAGDVLFRLEPIQALASADQARKELDALLAREARLTGELDGATDIIFPAELAASGASSSAGIAMSDERRQFAERRQSLETQTRALAARLDQAGFDAAGRARQKAALADQVDSLSAQLSSLSALVDKGFYPRNRLLEQERERTRLVGELGSAVADVARLEKVAEETRAQIDQLREKAREDAERDLADVRGRLPSLRERLAVATDVLTRVDIRAPTAGVIQNLHVTGAGAVIKPGETIADLVPAGERLIVAAHVSPLDIDSVAAGQKAEIRFPSLSRRQVPSIFGEVQSVSADAIVAEATRQSYYLATIVVDRADLPEAIAMKLKPGMPADAMIITGERTALAYLIEPLRNRLSKSMREK